MAIYRRYGTTPAGGGQMPKPPHNSMAQGGISAPNRECGGNASERRDTNCGRRDASCGGQRNGSFRGNGQVNRGNYSNPSQRGHMNPPPGHHSTNQCGQTDKRFRTEEGEYEKPRRSPPHGGGALGMLTRFIPQSVYNPETGKVLGFMSAEDLLIAALIILIIDSSDEETDNTMLVYALIYILISDHIDLPL